MLKPNGTTTNTSPLHTRQNNLNGNGYSSSGNYNSGSSTNSNPHSNSSLNVHGSLNGFEFIKANLPKPASSRSNSLRRNEKSNDENTESSFDYNGMGLKYGNIRKPTQMNNSGKQ